MATAAPFYRVPVVIFALLVGGLYVYAKAGGVIFGSGTSVTPATNANDEELAPPQIEFMMGPKSAPAFESAGAPQSPFDDDVPFAGSQSHLPPYVRPINTAPTNAAPTNAAPQPRQVLPGSKSAVVFPPTLSPSPPAPQPSPAYAQPVPQRAPATNNAAPGRPRAMPGSKSMILISPETATRYVQPTNALPRQQPLQLPTNQVQRPSNSTRNAP